MKFYKYIIIAMLFFGYINASAQVAVIANKSVAESTIDASKLSSIYSLKDKTWSDGKSIVPVMLKGDSQATDKFFSAVGKSKIEMNKLWMKLQLTGEGQAPEGMSSEDEVLNKVASTPGAIGFVSVSKAGSNVKILFTIN
jgi:ABC-type phosphate transport system substrate-binding protein